MHELALPLLIGLIAVALAFDFLNGLHDAANSIATVVATRLLSPVQAVGFAALFNFAAYFLTIAFPSLHAVAETIGKGLIDKELVTPAVVFAALVGAMAWNVLTWAKGIPSSSSHALVGGLIGAGTAHGGRACGADRHPVERAQQDADCDRALADAWAGAGDAHHAGVQLGAAPRHRRPRRADLPRAAPRLLRGLFAQPRP